MRLRNGWQRTDVLIGRHSYDWSDGALRITTIPRALGMTRVWSAAVTGNRSKRSDSCACTCPDWVRAGANDRDRCRRDC